MPVNSLPLRAAMVVSFQTGLSPTGVPIIRKKTLGNVRFNAAEQDIYDVAHALFSLTEHPALDVVLRKEFDLVDEG
ncbi:MULTISPECIES: DUF1659 domain-containing protein [Desulfitobacterium]|uniref:DUF1659 domain-containing protein n=1 Tax=Desulfitobacterium dehalogenans (strain ATCC 51507 / DSM 9161 / JW/IU-DC1) TaxID=756499 RepID=I4A3Q2_DESDJ|nr:MULTISPECIES: DUF1659 domain-containing protein [Desulfitobacterium]AFL98586.1 Protein of unknown function (DUF1659) [Desulfitobacterium dehalogenans ATCC 51507]